jgi:hypothetical protein
MHPECNAIPTGRGGFRLPRALDAQGRLVAPELANKGEVHTCPACERPVILRRGEKKRAHFAHRPCPDGSCGLESVLHMTAKLMVAGAVRAWLAKEAERPVFLRACAGLRTSYGCGNAVEHRLPHVDDVLVERNTSDGLRPDMVLVKDGTHVAAIEIFATHAVDTEKQHRMMLPWVELRAEDVVRLERVWLPTQDHFRPLLCEGCRASAAEYALRYRGGYLRGEVSCWKCRRSTAVFAWGAESWSTSQPPDPRPRTVQLRYSKTTESRYWANVCEHCGALQGDMFLHNEPDGPFFGIGAVPPPDQLVRAAVGWPDDKRKQLITGRARGDLAPRSPSADNYDENVTTPSSNAVAELVDLTASGATSEAVVVSGVPKYTVELTIRRPRGSKLGTLSSYMVFTQHGEFIAQEHFEADPHGEVAEAKGRAAARDAAATRGEQLRHGSVVVNRRYTRVPAERANRVG